MYQIAKKIFINNKAAPIIGKSLKIKKNIHTGKYLLEIISQQKGSSQLLQTKTEKLRTACTGKNCAWITAFE